MTPGQWARVLRAGQAALYPVVPANPGPTAAQALAGALQAMAAEADRIAREQA